MTTPSKSQLVNATIATSISPAQITADQNDYTPTGWTSSDVVRLDTDASRTITGFGAATQTLKRVVNVGSNDLVLAHQNVGSSAANRITTSDGNDLTLTAGQSAALWYDATSTTWRVLVGSASATSTLTAVLDTFSATLNQTAFTLTQIPLNDVVTMAVEGLVQEDGDVSVSGTSVTYSGDSLPAGTAVEFRYVTGAGTGEVLEVYQGSTESSVSWSSTTWAGFHTVPAVFADETQQGITRSNSTFTVTNAGRYWVEAMFNVSNPTPGYMQLRVRKSTTTLLKGSQSETGRCLMAGTIELAAGDSFDIQYVVNAAMGNWVVGTQDGETTRSGQITIWKMTSGGGGGGVAEAEITDQLTANVNNYSPTGWDTATVLLLDTDGSDYEITGLDATASVIRKTLANVSSNNITLKTADVGSTAANRFALTSDIVILPNGALEVFYDSTNSVWRAF